jgi:hypothetical protein
MTRFFNLNCFLIGSLVSVFCFDIQAQEVRVRGGFFADSINVGEPTKFYLTARYPSKLNLLFPDSTFDFSPFEYESKKYFPTNTVNGLSYDSVIYTISSFEIDNLQFLSLPAFVVNSQDSVTVDGNRDTIVLAELVKQNVDTVPFERLPLKQNTTYQNIHYLFNYPILLIVGGALFLAGLITFFVFGKKIKTHFKVKKLRRDYDKFITAYAVLVDQAKTAFSSGVAETTLITWKKYMEQLEFRPYTKLTTREIVKLEKDNNLGSSLQAIDKVIYGHPTPIVETLESLRDYASGKFFKKLEEVKHG